MVKYSYKLYKPYIKEGNLITDKKQISILSLSHIDLNLEVLEEFKTITQQKEEFIVNKNMTVDYLESSSFGYNIYMAHFKHKYETTSNPAWGYLTDDQINYFLTPIYSKLDFLKLYKDYFFKFTQIKKNILKTTNTYNYNNIISQYKNKDDKIEFEIKIWNYIRKMFMWCEDEVITAFLSGITDSLNKFKELHKNKNIEKDISYYDYKRAFNNLSYFLDDTVQTMLKIGKKEVKITTPLEIIERKEKEIFEEILLKEQKRLQKERKELEKKEESKKMVDEFEKIISARRDLLSQFNKI